MIIIVMMITAMKKICTADGFDDDYDDDHNDRFVSINADYEN
jgi:hypothetical protein